MKLLLIISILNGLAVLCCNAAESPESKLLTKLIPINDGLGVYVGNTDNRGDLMPSASDRTFHITKDYGYPGRYPRGYSGGYPYGTSPGTVGSIYPSTLNRDMIIPGHRGYSLTGPGGHLGYGYYSNVGNYPGYGGYGVGYGGYGDYGIRGYIPKGYGGYKGYESYDTGGYNGYNNYLGYGRGGYGHYDRYDTYGYGSGYGTNYGSMYGTRRLYCPYRRGSYTTSVGNPFGYHGYF